MEKRLTPIPRFNDHGASCKGHGNWMLDCTFETQSDRDIMINVIDRHIAKLDKEIEAEKLSPPPLDTKDI